MSANVTNAWSRTVPCTCAVEHNTALKQARAPLKQFLENRTSGELPSFSWNWNYHEKHWTDYWSHWGNNYRDMKQNKTDRHVLKMSCICFNICAFLSFFFVTTTNNIMKLIIKDTFIQIWNQFRKQRWYFTVPKCSDIKKWGKWNQY